MEHRNFSRELKMEAVKLIQERGVKVAQAQNVIPCADSMHWPLVLPDGAA